MIDRLTFHVRDGIAVTGVGKIYDPAKRKTRTMAGAVIRLSEYEDTGLDPWEIRRHKEQDELDRKTLLNFDCLGVEDLATRYCLARSERDSLKAERDAAVRDIEEILALPETPRWHITGEGCLCDYCEKGSDCNEPCRTKWRGPQQEET